MSQSCAKSLSVLVDLRSRQVLSERALHALEVEYSARMLEFILISKTKAHPSRVNIADEELVVKDTTGLNLN